jgi:transposase InsO family protein
VRVNAGHQHAVSDALRQAVLAQYAAHKSWSVQLHYDNLVALAETRPDLRPLPSYPTLRRFMKANGLDKRRRLTPRRSDGAERAEARIVDREIRSYEAEYVNGLWHWDCHHGSRKMLTQRGEWVTPILFGVLDDRSRLACHLQWYLAETAEVIAHGLSQAFQKRGLPHSALSDNGAAMTAAEIGQGLARLGVLHLVPCQGRVLLYAAEDALHIVRRRLDGIAAAAGVALADLDIQVITSAVLRLDLEADRRNLADTVARLQPRLLILDPFVRLHCIDENASGEVAPLLAYLRELQRRHGVAVLVVHHAKKGAGGVRAGQAASEAIHSPMEASENRCHGPPDGNWPLTAPCHCESLRDSRAVGPSMALSPAGC